jgi:hypothetical protein
VWLLTRPQTEKWGHGKGLTFLYQVDTPCCGDGYPWWELHSWPWVIRPKLKPAVLQRLTKENIMRIRAKNPHSDHWVTSAHTADELAQTSWATKADQKKTSWESEHKTLTLTTKVQVLTQLMSFLQQTRIKPKTKGCLLFSLAERVSVMTPAGYEPSQAKPSRFQIYHLNHLAQCQLKQLCIW